MLARDLVAWVLGTFVIPEMRILLVEDHPEGRRTL